MEPARFVDTKRQCLCSLAAKPKAGGGGRAGFCVLLVLPGLWEGDRALGTPALVVGLRGGVGVPAADPDQPPLFWDCRDTKDSERCGILSAAFRPLHPTW